MLAVVPSPVKVGNVHCVDRSAPVTRGDVANAFDALGLGGRPACVHSSLSSFGWVDGGADAVIDGILDAGCTLMVPAHAWSAYSVRPAADQWWERNGAHHAFLPAPGHNRESRYTTSSTAIDRAMGAIPARVLQRDGRVRGDHPLMSFAAVGPLAHALVDGQRADSVFAPVQTLADHGGAFVLMGVSLQRLTLLHYAEQLAGRQPLVRWANGPDGEPMEMEAGGCSAGFDRLARPLRGELRSSRVGPSKWITGDAAPVIAAAAAAMQSQPSITHCAASCARCDDVIAGGPSRRVNLRQ